MLKPCDSYSLLNTKNKQMSQEALEQFDRLSEKEEYQRNNIT